MKIFSKVLSIFLCLAMVMGSFSASAVAGTETASDVIIFNTGEMDIKVGKAEDCFVDFDENGNYEIEVEPNAYFPYEIQFKYDGIVESRWFETPDTKLEIKGHIFSIKSEQYDDYSLSTAGVMIGDEFIPAYPRAKTFKSEPEIKPASLIPFEGDKKKELILDLSGKSWTEVVGAKWSTVINGAANSGGSGQMPSDKKYLWLSNSGNKPDYMINKNNRVSFDWKSSNGNRNTIYMIVGDGKQLDKEHNTLYTIKVTLPNINNLGTVSLIKEGGNIEKQVFPGIREGKIDPSYLEIEVSEEELKKDKKIKLAFLSDLGSVEVYDFGKYSAWDYETIEDFTKDLSKFKKLDDSILASGYNFEKDNYIRLGILFTKGEAKAYLPIAININTKRAELGLSYGDSSSYKSVNMRLSQHSIPINYENVEEKFITNGNLTLKVTDFKMGDSPVNSSDYKIIKGHFDDFTKAESESDIKGNWQVKVDGERYDFSLLETQQKIIYKFVLRLNKIKNNTGAGEAQPAHDSSAVLKINGIKNIDCYILPVDRNYIEGNYQSGIILDSNANLSTLIPQWEIQGSTVTAVPVGSGAAAVPQKSGETEVDFSKGVVQYIANSGSGQKAKNYYVSFYKKVNDKAQLVVNGLKQGATKDTRTVHLNSISNNKYDIYLANIGSEELTGLGVDLENARNIKLDEYWTVGGENNDSLAAFTSVDTNQEAGLPSISGGTVSGNIARVRILPTSDGDVSGILVIKAKDHPDIRIALTGYAGDPKLITKEIPTGVKFVPYSAQLVTNNFYDEEINETSLHLIWGKLPKGIQLLPSGEIYGIPKETGTFEFGVELRNSNSRFGSDYARYTLKIEDNTNQNVIDSSDEGYKILDFVGSGSGYNDYIVNQHRDLVFRSSGKHNEFKAFYLNGEKLEKNSDYKDEEGSTKITILASTFKNKAIQNKERNTIAAEFRVDGSEKKELKRTAQNFIIDLNAGTAVPQNSGHTGSSENGGNTGGSTSGSQNTGNTKNSSSVNKEKPSKTEKKRESNKAKEEKNTTKYKVVEKEKAVLNQISLKKDGKNEFKLDKKDLGKLKDTNKKQLVQINLDGADKQNINLNMDQSVLNKLSSQKNVDLVLTNGAISIRLDHKALRSLKKQGKDIDVSVFQTEKGLDLHFKADDKEIRQLKTGVKISVPANVDRAIFIKDGEKKGRPIYKFTNFNGKANLILEGSGKVAFIEEEEPVVFDENYEGESVMLLKNMGLMRADKSGDFNADKSVNNKQFHTLMKRLDPVAYDKYLKVGEKLNLSSKKALKKSDLLLELYKYSKKLNLDMRVRGDVSKMKGLDKMDKEHVTAIRWAVGIGLIDNKAMNWKSSFNRGEMAEIIVGLLKAMFE